MSRARRQLAAYGRGDPCGRPDADAMYGRPDAAYGLPGAVYGRPDAAYGRLLPITRLDQYYFELYVLEVCIATLERGGTTSRPDTYQFLSSIEAWGLPKYPDRTMILPPDANLPQEVTTFVHNNADSFREKNCWLGTWIDPQTHNCYLDITGIYTRLEEARREAMALGHRAQRNIVALYDFKHGQAVYL